VDDPRKDALTRPDGIAARLSAMRTQAGLQKKDVAEAAGWHPSKVTRIEAGGQMPSPTDVREWATATGAPDDERDAVLDLLETALTRHVDWRLSMRRGQADIQREYSELVKQSATVTHFETFAVPGLLQTSTYAERMFREVRKANDLPVDDAPAAVVERMSRQRWLYEPGRRFEFLLAESVLRWMPVPTAAMRAQLDRLQTVIGLENVRFGIVPFGPVDAFPMTACALYRASDGTLSAYVETILGDSEAAGDRADRLARVVDRLWATAVEGDAARALITAAIQHLP